MLLVRFVLHIDVLSVSMRFSMRFCIYEHIQSHLLKIFSNKSFSEMTGVQHLFCFLGCSYGLGTLSHRIERQKLMVISRKEMSLRVRKGGFMANLFLR